MPEPGYVYTIWIEGSQLIKIGKSGAPEKRFKQLQRKSKDKLVLLALIATDDMVDLESTMHGHYSHHRIPQSEWFRLTDEPPPNRRHWVQGRTDSIHYEPGGADIITALCVLGNRVLKLYGLPAFAEWQAVDDEMNLLMDEAREHELQATGHRKMYWNFAELAAFREQADAIVAGRN